MSKIEWTDTTWNPVWGCEHKCSYCYAKDMARRFGERTATKEAEYLNIPLTPEFIDQVKYFKPTLLRHVLTKKLPKKPKMIFIDSMSDPAFWKEDWIKLILDKISEYPQHIFQILTKDPHCYIRFPYIPKNLWIGVTCTNQAEYNYRVPILCSIKNCIKFVSLEPLQGRIVINMHIVEKENKLDWVIVGGQTGYDSKAARVQWVDSIQKQCKAINIPFFFKGWGNWVRKDMVNEEVKSLLDNKPEYFDHFDIDGFMRHEYFDTGKRKAGRLLFGKEYMEFPANQIKSN